jgi:hypothetical protein
MKIRKNLDHLVGKGSLVLAGAAMLFASCTPWMYNIKSDVSNPKMNVVVYNSTVDAKPVYLTEKQFAENKPLQESLYAQAVAANDTYFAPVDTAVAEQPVEVTEAEGEMTLEMVPADANLDEIMDEPAAEEVVEPAAEPAAEPVTELVAEEGPTAKLDPVEDTYDPRVVKWEMQKELVDQHGVPVIIDVTKEGVYFCTDGIGQVLFDGDRKPYIDAMLENGKCDPSERIKNYVDGGELFDFAHLKTLEGFDEMETFRKSLLYKPLGKEE